MRRRKFAAFIGGAVLAWPLASIAQQPSKVRRIGLLSPASAATPAFVIRAEALRSGLRDLGYLEGKNIVIESRWAEGRNERLPELAAELVRMNVDVLVTHGTTATVAAKKATASIPIVMGPAVDPIGTGLVSSLARPGGNVTGMTYFLAELCQKRLELLKEVSPRTKRVAILMNAENQGAPLVIKALDSPAKLLNLEMRPFFVRRLDEIDNAFSAMAAARVDAIVTVEDPWLMGNVRKIVDLAARIRILSIGSDDVAESGGLMSYGINFPNAFRYLALFVDRILKGARPADIPVERSTKFELIVNRKTAEALGLKIPQSVLLRADRVIE